MIMQYGDYSIIYFQAFDIIKKFHERNRAPRAPDPNQLHAIRTHHATMDVDTDDDNEEASDDSDVTTDDDRCETRAKRHSQKPYTGRTNDPKKLGFYPPQWRDVLEAAQKKWRPWMVLVCAFPDRENDDHLNEALLCITRTLSEKSRKVEPSMNNDLRLSCC
jgi:hypothetical protein